MERIHAEVTHTSGQHLFQSCNGPPTLLRRNTDSICDVCKRYPFHQHHLPSHKLNYGGTHLQRISKYTTELYQTGEAHVHVLGF